MRNLLIALCAAFMFAVACASEAPLLADDPALEARVMSIAQELRCLVCQNETIAASHADLAIDLRQQIRTQLKAGRTAQQVSDFMVERYGEFVLYRPRFNARTLLLWLGPFVLLLVAALTLVVNVRRRKTGVPSAELSAADASRARRLLGVVEETRP